MYYSEKNWEKGVRLLQNQCTLQAAGPVSDYETQHNLQKAAPAEE